jgi:hypothetical protein
LVREVRGGIAHDEDDAAGPVGDVPAGKGDERR